MTDYMKISNNDTKLHIENIVADTTEGEITITLPAKTGKYKVDVIPWEDKDE